jgi:hypothetical protein
MRALEAAIGIDPARPPPGSTSAMRASVPATPIARSRRSARAHARPDTRGRAQQPRQPAEGTGRVDAAIAAYDQRDRGGPGLATAASNRLAALKLVADRTPSDMLAAHRAWASHRERDVPPRAIVRAMDTPDRPLRSATCRPTRTSRCPRSSGACSRRTIPISSRSTRTSTTRSAPEGSAVEARVARRVLAGLDNARVAALIASDDLDLLIDLAGHTGHNRLPVFARRPARVALTWLDYVSTTGMATVDFRVTDAVADPPDEAETGHSERLLRLPVPAWCWTPPVLAQEPGPPPLARVGVPTFGSFNHAMKLTDATLALWKPLFATLPTARLVAVGVPAVRRKRVVDALGLARRASSSAALDDAARRCTSVDVRSIRRRSRARRRRSTRCGRSVPVVTLPGVDVVALERGGLLTVSTRNWIARDAGRYLDRARAGRRRGAAPGARGVAHARARAPMTDVPAFVRHLETAYRGRGARSRAARSPGRCDAHARVNRMSGNRSATCSGTSFGESHGRRSAVSSTVARPA